MWYIWQVTYLRSNVTIVHGAFYHLLGSQISWDLKIQFQLQVKSYSSDWQFSKSWHLASYVSRHNAMAYDTDQACQTTPNAFCLKSHFLMLLTVINNWYRIIFWVNLASESVKVTTKKTCLLCPSFTKTFKYHYLVVKKTYYLAIPPLSCKGRT